MAQRAFTTHPLVVRRVEVRRIAEVTPRMRRITVGGERLGAFAIGDREHPAFAAPGFDDHLKLIFASDGDVEAAAPVQMEHGIEWGPSQTRQARDYTPRAVRADGDAIEVDLDFVLHGDGPAATWATNASVGDELWFVGPKSSTRLPTDLTRIVLVGDETALPAIGRFLDERPTAVPAAVAVIIGDENARQPLAAQPGDTVDWIVGDAADPVTLEKVVRAACGEHSDGLYVWVAGESRALLPVRRLLTRELGLAKSHVNVTGYWHAEAPGVVSAGAEAPEAPDASEHAGPARVRPVPVASPVPWLVVRAALQLGIVDAVADSSGISAAALAEACRVGIEQLELLLPVLLTHGVLAGDAAALGLGELGEEIIDDEHAREQFDGHHADVVLALADLSPALRAGTPPWQQLHGETVQAWSSVDEAGYDELLEGAEALAYLLDGLVADPVWSDAARVVLTGPGAALVIGALADTERMPRVGVWESAVGIAALRAQVEQPESVSWSVLPGDETASEGAQGADAEPADLAVAALALAHRTDDEAASLLHLLAGRAQKAIVIESSRPDGLSPRAAEAALHSFAVTGAPLRDTAAIASVGAGSGWRAARVVSLGWGIEATILER